MVTLNRALGYLARNKFLTFETVFLAIGIME